MKKTNRWTSNLHWRREGQQSRSTRTQNALLDAAETLILKQGIEATSVADIAKRAKTSVGSVYHHFKDKQALLYALFHRMMEDYAQISQDAVEPARWEGATIRDILGSFVSFSLASTKDRREYKAAALVVATAHPELRKHHLEIQSAMYGGLLELLLQRRDEIGHDDPAAAASFVLDQLGAMLRARLDPVLRPTQLDRRPDAAFAADAMQFVETTLHLKPSTGD